MALVEMQLASGVVWVPYFELRLHVWLSALHAMSGNTRQAIAELRNAADQEGVLSCTWCLRHWPHWDKVRSNPDFEALIVEQEAKLTALRQRLAAEGILLTPRQVLELENFSFNPFAQ